MDSAGIVDHPGPTIFFKIVDRDSRRNFFSIVEKDILRLLDYVNHEKKLYDKLSIAALISARTMHIARAEQLKALQRRKREVQQELYHATKTVTISRNNFSLLSHQHFRRDITAQIVSSAWDGTEYKYQLLQSLHDKLQKKTIFTAMQLYSHTLKTIRQICGHLSRTKNRRLLQLCFTSLILEGLSSLYITSKAMQRAETYLLRGVAATWFFTLLQSVRRKKKQKQSLQQAKLHFYFSQLRFSFRTFCKIQRCILRHQKLRRWACESRDFLFEKRAFVVWMSTFAKKQRLKLELLTKYGKFQAQQLLSEFHLLSKEECELLLRSQFRLCLQRLSLSLLSPRHKHSQPQSQPESQFQSQPQSPSQRRVDPRLIADGNPKDTLGSHAVWLGGYEQQQQQHHQTAGTAARTSVAAEGGGSSSCRNRMSNRVKNAVQIRKAFPSDRLSVALGLVYDEPHCGIDSDDDDRDDNGDGQSMLSADSLDRPFDSTRGTHYSYSTMATKNKNEKKHKTVFDRVLDLDLDPDLSSSSPHHHSSDSDDDDDTSGQQPTITIKTSAKLREIKIKRLLSFASLFIHRLQHNVHTTKARIRLTRKQRVRILTRRFHSWCSSLSKRKQQNTLSQQVYEYRLQTRVFQVWRDLHKMTKKRLLHLQTHILHLRQFKTQTDTFRKWSQKYRLVLHYEYSCLQVKLCQVKTHFRTWQKVWKKCRFHKIAVLVLQHRKIRPFFGMWRRKFANKKLLQRVFAVRETALQFRNYQNNYKNNFNNAFKIDFINQHFQHNFHLLLSIFTAWKSHTQTTLAARKDTYFGEKALFFRGSVLLSRYFYGWRTFLTYEKLLFKYHVLKEKRRKRRIFHEWQMSSKSRVVSAQQQVEQSLNILQQSRIFQRWRKVYFIKAIQKSLHHRVHSLQKRHFQAWKVVKALRFFYNPTRLSNLTQRHKQRILFTWNQLFRRRQKYRLGLVKLQKLYFQVCKKNAFLNWPGRREIWAGNQLREKIERKGKSRIKLVDIASGDYCSSQQKTQAAASEEQKEQKSSSTSPLPPAATTPNKQQSQTRLLQYTNIEKSFIRAHGQRNFSELAYALGFLTTFPDPQGLTKIHDLVTTLFSLWIEFVAYQKKLRLLAAEVRIRQRMKMLKSVVRKWIASTPRVSYRIITWLEERDPDNLRFDRRVVVKKRYQYIF